MIGVPIDIVIIQAAVGVPGWGGRIGPNVLAETRAALEGWFELWRDAPGGIWCQMCNQCGDEIILDWFTQIVKALVRCGGCGDEVIAVVEVKDCKVRNWDGWGGPCGGRIEHRGRKVFIEVEIEEGFHLIRVAQEGTGGLEKCRGIVIIAVKYGVLCGL